MLYAISTVLALATLLAPTLAASDERSISILAWPVRAATPQPFATIDYTYPTLNTTLKTYTRFQLPESLRSPASPDEYIRLGFNTPQVDNKDTWTGIAISLFSLAEEKTKTLRIYVDEDGRPTHLGFDSTPFSHVAALPSPTAKGKAKGKGKVLKSTKKTSSKDKKNTPTTGAKSETGGLVVEVLRPTPGPKPVLNKPVVLNAEGKLDDKEPEKSFLQK